MTTGNFEHGSTAPSSRTAQVTPDAIGLGLNQGQRTAELMAAFRAEVMPTPENKALTSVRGTTVAGVFNKLLRNKGAFNFVIARSIAIQHAIQASNILKSKPSLKIVEVAAGLSPRGLLLARTLPNVEVIEVDLANVVKEKQARYKKAKIDIPANLTWRSADLGVTPLLDVLEKTQVDVILAEGLNQYFTPDDIKRIAKNFCDCLVPGGLYITDLTTEAIRKEAFQQMHGAIAFFTRHSGTFVGILPDEATARTMLNEVGYDKIDIYRASTLTEQMAAVPKPILDLSLIFCAAKKLN